MNSKARRVTFALAIFSAMTAAAFVGCAESPPVSDDEGDTVDDSTFDSGPKKTRDASKGTEDSGDDGTEPNGDDDSGPGDDTDADPGFDAGFDAGKDAGKLPGTDAGKDAGFDAGKDTGTDAGFDAGTDPGADAGDAGAFAKPAQGEVVISEVMFNPSAADEPLAEWFELYNTTANELRLSGLTIKDKSRTHVIGAGVTIKPGTYVLLVRNTQSATTAQVPAAAVLYDYGQGAVKGDPDAIQFTNKSDGDLTLLDGTTEVARAHYGALGFGSTANGTSIQLTALDYTSANDKTKWCKSTVTWAANADHGSPGAAADCTPTP